MTTQVDRDIIENLRMKKLISVENEILPSDRKEIYTHRYGIVPVKAMRYDFLGSKIYIVKIKGKIYEYHADNLPTPE